MYVPFLIFLILKEFMIEYKACLSCVTYCRYFNQSSLAFMDNTTVCHSAHSDLETYKIKLNYVHSGQLYLLP